jgi:hypothetical protein
MDKVGLDVVLDIEEHYAAIRPGIPPKGTRDEWHESAIWRGLESHRCKYIEAAKAITLNFASPGFL